MAPCGKRCPTSSDFYDEEGFESDDSWELDSDSSGPQIDRYPSVRKGRVLRFCRQCGHHQYWGEVMVLWLRVGSVAPPVEDRTFPRKQGKGKRRQWYPPRKGIYDLSRLGAGETALGPNPQEPAPRQILLRRNQRRRHRPLLPAETVDPKARAPPPREGFFDTWWCYNCKAKVSTHALKCPTCNRPRGDNRSWRNAGTNRPEYKAPPKARPSSPPPSTAPDASQAPPPRPTKAAPGWGAPPLSRGPATFPKLLPSLHLRRRSAILFTGYVGRVERSMGCIATAAIHAVHPSTLRVISTNTPPTGYALIVKTKCLSNGRSAICGKWRPRGAPLINHGQAAEDPLRRKGSCSRPGSAQPERSGKIKVLDWAWRNRQWKGHTQLPLWIRSA